MNDAFSKALAVQNDASVDRILATTFWRPREAESAPAVVVRLPIRHDPTRTR